MKMDSLMVLTNPWSSLPMMLKLLFVMLCPVCMCMDGRGLLQLILSSFPKGPCSFPYVLLIAGYVIALEAVDYPTFLVLLVLVLGFHEDLLDCGVALEVSLYSILTTCLFETFHHPQYVWYDYISHGGIWS